jgi:hypothetical protein
MIYHKFYVTFISFQQNMEKQKSKDFCSDLHIYIVVWIFCSIKNVMKWIVILSLDFSTLYFEMQILVLWNNNESGFLINYKIRCV